MIATVRFMLLFLCSMSLWANTNDYSWYTLDAKNKATINVEVFLSSTCPYCHKENEFFKKIEPQMPWLHVERHMINEDKSALVLFNQLLTQQQFDDFAIPSAFFCNTRWVGFTSEQTTGTSLIKALTYCKKQIEKEHELTPTAVNIMKHWANANMVNTSMTTQPSMFYYTALVALLDMSNPCGLMCMAAFFALLFLQCSKKNQFISGALFLIAILLIHLMQQTQTNLFFQLLYWLRIPTMLLGCYSLYVAYRYYKKQPIKPYSLFIWAFFLALMTQANQQVCVMNWALIFQQWLSQQPLSMTQKLIVQVSYQLIYFLPMVATLLIYIAIQRFKWFVAIKSYLEVIGLLFISIVALFLIIYPTAMGHYMHSVLIVLAALVIGVGIGLYQQKQREAALK